jgi:hypothetical protein
MSDKKPELTVTDARELARAMALALLPLGTELDGRDVSRRPFSNANRPAARWSRAPRR